MPKIHKMYEKLAKDTGKKSSGSVKAAKKYNPPGGSHTKLPGPGKGKGGGKKMS